MERLKIQNFAGIRLMDFEFKSISVLIGPQASGKSITVKLFYFFKNYLRSIGDSIVLGESQIEFDAQQKERFITYFPKESWPKNTFKITYTLDNIEIIIRKQRTSISITLSSFIKQGIDEVRKIYADEKGNSKNDPKFNSYSARYDLERKLRKLLGEKLVPSINNNQFFIPAGRSFFANIQRSIFSFLSDNRSLDPFLIEFGSFYENMKGIYDDIYRFNKKSDFVDNVSTILNSTYKKEKEKDYLVHSDNRKVNLSNASSGQQETLPLILILSVINNIGFSNGGATIYIEEPEAHLFPVAQKRIVQLLAKVFNNKESRFQFVVTTHSPYILASFNNLLEAGQLANIKPKQSRKIAKVVPKNEQINPDVFCAYSLENGEMQNLIDQDSKLISQTILDNISNEIANEFGALLDIEF